MFTPSTFSISRYARALIEQALLCLKTITGFFVESDSRCSSAAWLSILKNLFPIVRWTSDNSLEVIITVHFEFRAYGAFTFVLTTKQNRHIVPQLTEKALAV